MKVVKVGNLQRFQSFKQSDIRDALDDSEILCQYEPYHTLLQCEVLDDTFSGVHDESINEFVIKAESHRHSLSGHPFLMSNDVNMLRVPYMHLHPATFPERTNGGRSSWEGDSGR